MDADFYKRNKDITNIQSWWQFNQAHTAHVTPHKACHSCGTAQFVVPQYPGLLPTVILPTALLSSPVASRSSSTTAPYRSSSFILHGARHASSFQVLPCFHQDVATILSPRCHHAATMPRIRVKCTSDFLASPRCVYTCSLSVCTRAAHAMISVCVHVQPMQCHTTACCHALP